MFNNFYFLLTLASVPIFLFLFNWHDWLINLFYTPYLARPGGMMGMGGVVAMRRNADYSSDYAFEFSEDAGGAPGHPDLSDYTLDYDAMGRGRGDNNGRTYQLRSAGGQCTMTVTGVINRHQATRNAG